MGPDAAVAAGGDAFPLPAGDIEIPAPLRKSSANKPQPPTPTPPAAVAGGDPLPTPGRTPPPRDDADNETLYNHNDARAQTTAAATAPLSPLLEGKAHLHAAAAAADRSLVNPLARGAPGDGAPQLPLTPEEAAQSRRRSQYFGEAFAAREAPSAGREGVLRDSIVACELKTNVIVDDEYHLLTNLSAFLAQRYARPQSSVCIALAHSACLLLGGSFEPAYQLTLTALPAFVQPTLNKRNAHLLQDFLADELAVPPHRGLVRFDAVPEGAWATAGATVAGQLEAAGASAAAAAHATGKAAAAAAGTTNGGHSPAAEHPPESGLGPGSLARRFTRKKAEKAEKAEKSGSTGSIWHRRAASGSASGSPPGALAALPEPVAPRGRHSPPTFTQTAPASRRGSPPPRPPLSARGPAPADAFAGGRAFYRTANPSRDSLLGSLSRKGSALRGVRAGKPAKQAPPPGAWDGADGGGGGAPAPNVPAFLPPRSPRDAAAEKAQKLGKRRSFLQGVFGR